MKTTKTLLAAAILAGTPALAMAACDYSGHREATVTCAPGTTLDTSTGSCVAETTS